MKISLIGRFCLLLALCSIPGVFVKAAPAPFYAGLSLDGHYDFGEQVALGMGPKLFFSWSPDPWICLEANIAMKRLVGWEVALGVGALWRPALDPVWQPALGVGFSASYASSLVVESNSGGALARWPLGPVFRLSPGICIAPMIFNFPAASLSVLKTTAWRRFSAIGNSWALECELFSLAFPLGGPL